MINGRSHITAMVLALVRDSITCKLRQAEGGPMQESKERRDGGIESNGGIKGKEGGVR